MAAKLARSDRQPSPTATALHLPGAIIAINKQQREAYHDERGYDDADPPKCSIGPLEEQLVAGHNRDKQHDAQSADHGWRHVFLSLLPPIARIISELRPYSQSENARSPSGRDWNGLPRARSINRSAAIIRDTIGSPGLHAFSERDGLSVDLAQRSISL
jgi:hypothetical protein